MCQVFIFYLIFHFASLKQKKKKKNLKGGSGFLGQHLVKLIQERDDKVKEIRIVDLLPYTNRISTCL